MTEREKIQKYEAIGMAKCRENNLRRYIMISKCGLEKACSSRCTEESMGADQNQSEFYNSEKLKLKVADILYDLMELNKSLLLLVRNDIIIATYLSPIHWWYELWSDFLNVIMDDEEGKFYYNNKYLELPFKNIDHFIIKATKAMYESVEWNKTSFFEKYI